MIAIRVAERTPMVHDVPVVGPVHVQNRVVARTGRDRRVLLEDLPDSLEGSERGRPHRIRDDHESALNEADINPVHPHATRRGPSSSTRGGHEKCPAGGAVATLLLRLSTAGFAGDLEKSIAKAAQQADTTSKKTGRGE